eukprot:m.124108 g.124108  ORF g.124108 m.124108 type:complete len:445 (+) comp15693_c0_seq2:311-1645(+)
MAKFEALNNSKSTIIDVDDVLHLKAVDQGAALENSKAPSSPDSQKPLDKRAILNVIVLTTCFAIGQAAFFTQISTTGIAASEFADDDLGTVPVGSLMVVTIFCGYLIQRMLNKYSATAVYSVTTVISLIGAVFQVLSTRSESFALLTLGTAIQGFGYSATLSYRLTVISAVPAYYAPKAIAWVLAGGTLAAIGPEISRQTIDSLDDRFMGPYIAVCGFYVLLLVIVQLIQMDASSYSFKPLPPDPTLGVKENEGTPARTLKQLLCDPKYLSAVLASAVIYGSMSGIMNATPLEMREVGHSFDDSTLAVQIHSIGMFLPAAGAGFVVARVGAVPTTIIGFSLFIASTALYYINDTTAVFSIAMAGVGVGWSLGLVGATAMLSTTFKPSEKTMAQSFNEIIMVLFLAIYVVTASFAKTGLGWELYLGAQMLGVGGTLVLLLVLRRC